MIDSCFCSWIQMYKLIMLTNLITVAKLLFWLNAANVKRY